MLLRPVVLLGGALPFAVVLLPAVLLATPCVPHPGVRAVLQHPMLLPGVALLGRAGCPGGAARGAAGPSCGADAGAGGRSGGAAARGAAGPRHGGPSGAAVHAVVAGTTALLVLVRVVLQIPVVAVTVVLLVALALLRAVLLVPDATIPRHCRWC